MPAASDGLSVFGFHDHELRAQILRGTSSDAEFVRAGFSILTRITMSSGACSRIRLHVEVTQVIEHARIENFVLRHVAVAPRRVFLDQILMRISPRGYMHSMRMYECVGVPSR